MKKIYVLDTNVLLQDPRSIFSFEDNEVVIPAVVLEEVDSKKRNMDEVGRNARQISKMIDHLRTLGSIHNGVKLESGGLFRIELNHRSFIKLQEIFDEKTNDNRILAVALNLSLEEDNKQDGRPVILVSKDVLMRVKADTIGLQAEDFLSDRVVEYDDHIYSGFQTLYISPELLNNFYTKGELKLSLISKKHYFPNEFLVMKDIQGSSQSALGIVDEYSQKVKKCLYDKEQIWGIKSRNVQQTMGLELLLKADIPLITLIGKAGTGKTLLALAAGLYRVSEFPE